MKTLLTADPILQGQPFQVPLHDPVEIRLAVHARGMACQTPDAHYLVVVGLFKLLRDLTVLDFHHSRDAEGLVFYLAVRESRSVVRSYLNNTKKYHVLGDAWDLVLVDGSRVSTVLGDACIPPLSSEALHQLAFMHRRMGSRPLRFSRYFLTAALLPFGRERGYGSALMQAEDAKGRVHFYSVLQGLELLQRSFATLDFSGISSAQELHIIIGPLEKALQNISKIPRFFATLLYPTLLLACCYEQKVRLEDMVLSMKAFHGSDPLWRPLLGSREGVETATEWLFTTLLGMLHEQPGLLTDPDDLSLQLLATFEDLSTKQDMTLAQYRQVQQLAYLAWKGRGVDRDQLNQFFYRNHLVTDGVRDALVFLRLLSFMEEEETT